MHRVSCITLIEVGEFMAARPNSGSGMFQPWSWGRIGSLCAQTACEDDERPQGT